MTGPNRCACSHRHEGACQRPGCGCTRYRAPAAPAAIAAPRVIPGSRVRELPQASLPQAARDFIDRFDSGQPAEPFSFTLTWREDS